jgi:hypothetical protein
MSNTLTAHQATIIGMEALRVLRKESVMVKRVRKDYSEEVAQHGKVVTIPKFGAMSANNKTLGSSVTVQDATSTSVNVTLNKHKEATFIIDDFDRAISRNDLLAGYMNSAMVAVVEAVEDDLLALYAGLSGSIGTGGTDLTAAVVRLARKTLTDNKSPRGDRTLVISTKDVSALLAADSQFLASYNNTAEKTKLEEGIIGRYMGFDVMESQAVPVVDDTPDVTHNIAFHKDAFALVTRPLDAVVPQGLGVVVQNVTDPETGLTVRVVLSYNKDRLGVQCTVDLLYGVAEVRDELAVDVKS